MYSLKLHNAIKNSCRSKSLRGCKSKLSDLSAKPDPRSITKDYVGPPDKLSNIRPYVRHIPKNETDLERRLRQMQEQTEKWNHDFWSNHNKNFYQEREEFVKTHGAATNGEVTADEMSEFYKAFLDKNKENHFRYNFSWYLKNFEMLKLAFRVSVVRVIKRVKMKILK
ncbi:COA8 family protein CG14806, mitochondrial isoform X2 [Bactrocera neohumeralis]|uniref:COA8 family protein CG14806, mitochondrial isoform X1 n=1 Tax=Bactrocera tryoni TaxID=59916 RepID=UPI001A96D05B|nr:COA8 family protein CG14806, mitochondrial isoform X1 [Bactrocera tryoni]XP_050331614.1 COA8 family protein CG14806, mitochondrial isoform X2 [Bactrocera neohumeralis]